MKKTILLTLLSLGIVGLAVVAVLTALQLQKIGTTPIAPTGGGEVAAAQNPCVTTFTVQETGASPSPSASVSPSPSASVSPSPSASVSPSPSASVSPSPSPSAELAVCGDSCSVDIDCSGSMICVNSKCVNPQCTGDSDCVCGVGGPAKTPTPTPTPEETEEVELPEAGVTLPTLGLLAVGLTTLLLGALVLVW